MQNLKLTILTLSLCFFTQLVFSQSETYVIPEFKIHQVLPFVTLSKEDISKATNLLDINPRFPTDWIRIYINVEIISLHEGKKKTTIGENGQLTKAQKSEIATADAGIPIEVRVNYLPENKLQDNEVKTYRFSFTIEPEKKALFVGGEAALKDYLKKNLEEKIPENSFKGYEAAIVKFTINEAGEVTNFHLFEPAKQEEVNRILMNGVQQMPCWQPAEYANGTKVAQEFILAAGNMESCSLNLFTFRP